MDKLPLTLIKKYEREAATHNKKLKGFKLQRSHHDVSSVGDDVKKIISLRANLDLKYFTDKDVLSKPYLEFTSRRFQALAISLNEYLKDQGLNKSVSYAEVTKKDLTVEGLIKVITDKIAAP